MSLQISPEMFLLGGGVMVVIGVAQKAWTYRQDRLAAGYTPTLKSVISMLRPTMAVLPSGRIPFSKEWYISLGPNWWTSHKYESFRKLGQDVIVSTSLDGMPTIFMVADADIAQEVMINRARFTKPIHLYGVLELYGANVVTTEGDEWRIHRKITGPSFSESSNKLVCDETVLVMEGLLDTWNNKSVIEYEDFSDVTMQLALMVICGAGFGIRVSWTDTDAPEGHKLSFKSAMEAVSGGLLLKFAMPGFAMSMTERTSKIQTAFDELKVYIREMIRDRASNYRDYSDLFTGHETTAHTLAFTIGFLALYPDVQEKLYEHVKREVADHTGAPTYNEVPKLKYALAVFYETLRLFSSVPTIPKISTEDTSVRTVNNKGEPVVVPIPKGSYVSVIAPALHHNPRYWPEPDEFKPERFLGDWPKNAFVPFSGGARSCIGRRFAEVEGVIALSMLVRNYRIEVKHDPKFVGETFAERKARVLKFSNFITVTPEKVPVTFIRR
ncbi:hypothetical protein M408DRAFT_25484 [Serendipita vermifera MAFF 305830]|uniref:Cytochrome P450 n=1 Tax=Serendipita vermifera MAFF 305830 TaxID=933852 RepID=A0A0C3B460_SERVB|nr:hypothetical protein M408DRAFT_25484 [Serendipita vermifera MAFF 305830]